MKVTTQAISVTLGTNSTVTASFAGVPGYPYQVQRAAKVAFIGTLRVWSTNAPPRGLFQAFDNFSDLGSLPVEAYSGCGTTLEAKERALIVESSSMMR